MPGRARHDMSPVIAGLNRNPDEVLMVGPSSSTALSRRVNWLISVMVRPFSA